MFSLLSKFLLNLWAGQFKKYSCPKCSFTFNPFERRELTSWKETVVCPQCGWTAGFREALEARGKVIGNFTGPFERPPESKIERNVISKDELLFVIPATRNSNGMLLFAVLWNLMSWAFFFTAVSGISASPQAAHSPFPLLFLLLFPAIGIGLAYFAVRMAFASHLLYLGPERVRLQRQLLGWKKNFDLPTACIDSVQKVTFYSKNYQPVCGIEIKAAGKKIRFGSSLTEPEKNWLRWEIHAFAQGYSPTLL